MDTDTQKRRSCGDGGREESGDATAKEHLEAPEGGRAKETCAPGVSGGNADLLTP